MLRHLIISLSLAASAPAGVVINEILYHPASEDSREEFIELHNTDAIAADVSGWQITSGVACVFPAGTMIAPGGYLVVAADPAVFATVHPGVPAMPDGWIGKLSNSSNRIRLVNATGITIDDVHYADDGDWATRTRQAVLDYGHRGWTWSSTADEAGHSIELMNPLFDNASGQNWSASTLPGGTPGAANSTAAADIAPVILDATHAPLVPTTADPIAITARVIDDQGALATVDLHWRVDGAPAFATASMYDDGVHGDGGPGDGIHGVLLPAQANNAIIEFYIEAGDGSAHTRTWPAAARDENGVATQSANALLQVDDTVDAGAMPVYRVILKAADKIELNQINTNAPAIAGIDQTMSHSRFNATWITRDGTGWSARYRCGARNRGNSSRATQPQSFNVAFTAADPWDDVVEINLNSQYTPHQILGSTLYRQAGVAMAMARAVQVRINGSNPATAGAPAYGMYAALEFQDSDFVARHFPQDSSGNLYRGLQVNYSNTDPGGDLGDWSDNPDPALADPTPYRPHYPKRTNVSEDNWADLIGLTQQLAKGQSPTLNAPTYSGDYADAIRAVVDVDQWMKFFAVQTIADNTETNLSNGRGDDYFLYIGATDPRARLIPYDLDSVFGRSSSSSASHGLFLMCQNPSVTGSPPTPVNPLMKHPDFAPIYYRELRDMIDGPMSVASFNAMTDHLLTGIAPDATITAMKAFHASRVAYINSEIPRALGVTTTPATLNGYPHTTTATITMAGQADAVATRSVKVNGLAAAWSAWDARWNMPALTLAPGINSVLIQSFDGAGNETARLRHDVWYDDGSIAEISGSLAADTTWTAAGGPYRITGTFTVPAGRTLTIDAGATVYCAASAAIAIANGGRILAAGSDTAPILFSMAPGTTGTWQGITIQGAAASPRTILRHARIEKNNATAITVTAGDVTLEAIEFANPAKQFLSLDGASFEIAGCYFPATTAAFEGVHGTLGIRADGRGIIRGSYFGAANGYNDVVDFTGGQRPGPILQVIGNVFAGTGDDILDLDGTDAWVESNIFLHVHKNGAPDSAAAVSGGNNGASVSRITIIGNLFYDVDHALTAKQGNYYTFLSNTVLRQTIAGGTDVEGGVINMRDAIPEPPTTFGAGCLVESNVIADATQLARNYDPGQSVVTFNNNLLPHAWTGGGSGNVLGDPLFVHVPEPADVSFATWEAAQMMWEWLAPGPGSPATGTGAYGRNKGGVNPRGAAISGEPIGTTQATTATLQIGPVYSTGLPWTSGYTQYRWRLDGWSWSADVPISQPIVLAGLATGAHQIEVSACNDAGYFQDDPAMGSQAVVSASRVWTVDPGYTPPAAAALVRINEVLAKNTESIAFGTVFPDAIELYNAGTASADIGGWGLSDDPALPFRYTIPAGTTLAAGARLVIYASNNAAVPLPRTGFALDDTGETVVLTRAATAGGGMADQVVFGRQLADYTIGRRESDGGWDLCRPTLGTANIPAPRAASGMLRINEWLAAAGALAGDDFIELHNAATLPVALGGCWLTDSPQAWPDRHVIAPLSFIAGSGFAVFKADGNTVSGADHLAFKLDAGSGEIALADPTGTRLDLRVYGPQTTDVSEGRSPDGADLIAGFTQPTPGGPNPSPLSPPTTITLPLIATNAAWKFRSSSSNFSVAPNFFADTAFNDTAWSSGPALHYIETATLSSASGFVKSTALTANAGLPFNASNFRHRFQWNGSTDGVILRATVMVDDGAVIYINGSEAARLRMNSGTITFATSANATVGDAVEETLTLPANLLVQGENTIAVAVHQVNTTSSDVVFGLKLDAVTSAPAPPIAINEIVAVPSAAAGLDGALPGWIELTNTGEATADISGMSLSDSAAVPRKWIAPAGTTIPAHGHLVIACDAGSPAGPANTGFALASSGGSILLFDAPAQGGGTRDGITFGNQIAGRGIGRVVDGTGAFALTLPSPAAPNAAAALGALASVRVNEWMANPAGGPDWFELFNSSALPVAIGGTYLTDQLTNKTKSLIAPLSFLGGTGSSRWSLVLADSSSAPGHANFALSAAGEALGMFTGTGVQVDAITFAAQPVSQSEGRLTDGAGSIGKLLASPGSANRALGSDSDLDGLPDDWEILHGFNPAIGGDANGDPDGDGARNLAELAAGTDPRLATSVLVATALRDGSGQFALGFHAEPGITYSIFASDDLGTWTKLGNVQDQGAAVDVEVVDPATSLHPARFYRIVSPRTVP